jgi:hypothetical protein
MDWFWHALWICFVVIPVTVLWITCVVSIFVRHDLSIWARLGWLLVVLVIPLFGALLYLLFTPASMFWRDTATYPPGSRTETVADPQGKASQPSPQSSLVSDISAARQLHASGALTDEEFQRAKDRLLSAVPRQSTDSTINVS